MATSTCRQMLLAGVVGLACGLLGVFVGPSMSRLEAALARLDSQVPAAAALQQAA